MTKAEDTRLDELRAVVDKSNKLKADVKAIESGLEKAEAKLKYGAQEIDIWAISGGSQRIVLKNEAARRLLIVTIQTELEDLRKQYAAIEI